jgi:hypothetical protein
LSQVTVEHWHLGGILRADPDHPGKLTVHPATYSIKHLHPHDDHRPHVHQWCTHVPQHRLGTCSDPVSAYNEGKPEPPLLWNSAEDPERAMREGQANLGTRRQRELGIEGQV